jgi:4-amino-4-deoxy-L-arabinose transferase-like glycosyltransferase
MAILRSASLHASSAARADVARLAAYAALFVVPALLLAPWFTAVLDRDEGAYASVALGMRDGLVPYRDLFDHKPPLIYATYWLSFLIDEGVWLPRALAAASWGATSVIIVHAARSLRLSNAAAWCGGVVCAFAAAVVHLQANANTEVFLLPFASASLLLVANSQNEDDARLLTVAGACASVAVLFKTSAVFPACALVLWLLLQRRKDAAAAFCAGAIVPLGACAAIFVALGALDEFWYANVTYNRLYADVIPYQDRLLGAIDMNPAVLTGGLGLWLFAAFGACLALRMRSPESLLLLLWAAGCWASVKFTGRDHAHYYVQMIPGVALLSALVVDWFASRKRLVVERVIATLAVSTLVVWQGAVYGSSVISAERRAEVHEPRADLRACEAAAPAIGSWIAARTSPDDRVYNLGRDSSIYFYARRQPAARFMYDRPFYLGADTSSETASALRTSRPRYIADTTKHCGEGAPTPAPLRALLAEQYVAVATVETATIYELRQ